MLTCRHFGLPRPTFYRWQQRFHQHGLAGLDDRSHRPKRVRRPEWTAEHVQSVLTLRERHPRWEKAKLTILLTRDGQDLSCSMVGRILRDLRARGRLHEGSDHDDPATAWLVRMRGASRKTMR
jgi:transposase